MLGEATKLFRRLKGGGSKLPLWGKVSHCPAESIFFHAVTLSWGVFPAASVVGYSRPHW
jgi:hypothetical protein